MLDVTKEKTLLYCRNQKRLGRDAKTKAAKEIASLYKDIHEKAQQKAQIASEMYDFIDGKIRELDKRTNQFNMKMFKSAAHEQKKLGKLIFIEYFPCILSLEICFLIIGLFEPQKNIFQLVGLTLPVLLAQGETGREKMMITKSHVEETVVSCSRI